MKEFEEEIFEVLEEEYNKKNSDNVVWEIIRERVRIATKLIMVSGLNDENISNISGLSLNDIKSIRG
ncbi:hypothetical protein G9F71_000750 [Clostridium sp. FP2]|uniref:hypothetical protein n=1 Tax=Clostridium sp. FP2 TaxID=2724481 RepID=UPI0013E97B1A|nr:hypothetical protein [Clostridium sp. FP2]MBZ9621420.1 hypothetical protein [Clostridium sp. FP2]